MKRFFVVMLWIGTFLLCGCKDDGALVLSQEASAESREADGEAVVDDAVADELFDGEETGGDGVYVYICGAVAEPGVYQVDEGGRIYELVELAGGFTEDADTCSVNLAETVEDGQMIQILTQAESEALTAASSASTEAVSGSGKININTATATELTALNGIGEAKAAAIVAYRETYGSFQSIEEIMLVDGIAEGTYEKIRAYIEV